MSQFNPHTDVDAECILAAKQWELTRRNEAYRKAKRFEGDGDPSLTWDKLSATQQANIKANFMPGAGHSIVSDLPDSELAKLKHTHHLIAVPRYYMTTAEVRELLQKIEKDLVKLTKSPHQRAKRDLFGKGAEWKDYLLAEKAGVIENPASMYSGGALKHIETIKGYIQIIYPDTFIEYQADWAKLIRDKNSR